MFEQEFRIIDDILWKEAGRTAELDYTAVFVAAVFEVFGRVGAGEGGLGAAGEGPGGIGGGQKYLYVEGGN